MLHRGADAHEAEFAAYYRAAVPAVRRFAARMVGVDASDDIVSETFTIAWQRWADVPADGAHRRAWTFRVAHFRIQHWYESRARSRDVPLQRTVDTVDDHADRIAADDWATQLLAQLSPPERAAIVLVVWYGMSAADAAYVLGCTPSALSTRLQRARQHLHGLMQTSPESGVSR